MAKIAAPFRYDIVGSFLRPQRLKDARDQFAKGEISADDLTKVEDEEIAKLIEKEKQVGLHAVTDGEFRRSMWHLDFLTELVGAKEVSAEHWSVHFQGHQPKSKTVVIADKIDFENHPFVEHFKKTQQLAGGALVKQTIPSPTMLHLICCVREEHYQPIDRYKDNEALLLEDIALAYQKAVQAFYDAGCRYLQFDDTSWGELCDPEKRAAYEARGINVDELAKKYVALINKALENKPEDLAVTIHICRGNFRSTWFSSGGYDPVAPILFPNLKVDGFFLEYDSDRAGGFEPLAHIANQKVVLGLVTSKSGELEDPVDVKARINEASKYVPLEQLCLSPQCGFSSTEEGNILTEEDQWKKLTLIRQVAKEVWQDA
ncbi:MAG: 5-methyltetrahydropteroyltriglutamate--homocysteine S-methyltransferase [Eggerthellaceae bacterium]